MVSARESFWSAAKAAQAALHDPGVRARWDDDSVLAQMTVGDVAAHLVRAVSTVVGYLAEPAPDGPPITAAEYYIAVLGDPADIDSEVNTGVRVRSRKESSDGCDAVLARWAEACQAAQSALADTAPDRLVAVAAGRVLTVDEYLLTRTLELVVHTDDLALSIAIPTPTASDVAYAAVSHLLIDLARRRHGDLPVVRAMARRERESSALLRVL